MTEELSYSLIAYYIYIYIYIIIYNCVSTANQPSVSMTTSSAKEEDEQRKREDDVTADGTTEHEF